MMLLEKARRVRPLADFDPKLSDIFSAGSSNRRKVPTRALEHPAQAAICCRPKGAPKASFATCSKGFPEGPT